MIAHLKTNKSFRQTTRYVVEKEKAQIIGGNMAGQTVSQLVAEFRISGNLNTRIKNPCYHIMLSLPKQETLSDTQFAQMGTKFFASLVVLSRLTGDKAQMTSSQKRIKESELNEQVENFLKLDIHQYSYFIARHHDREHQHIHIVASRLNEITGKAIQTWQNYPKGEYVARILEKQYNLTSIECSWEGKTKALTRSQRDRVKKEGLPKAELIRRAIDEAAKEQPTLPELIERLSHQGIVAEVTYHPTGKVRGIRYSMQSERSPKFQRLTLTGSQLNRHKYSFFKLQSELGVSYVPERDDEYLKTTIGKAQDLLNFSLSETSSHTVFTSSKNSPLNETQKDSPTEDESLILTPQNSERIEQIKQGYLLYKAANTIMTLQGKPKGNFRYFEGKTYRIDKQGATLIITHKAQDRIVYQATDNREQGSIIDINQLHLNSTEIEAIQAYARSIEQARQRAQQQTSGRGFER